MSKGEGKERKKKQQDIVLNFWRNYWLEPNREKHPSAQPLR